MLATIRAALAAKIQQRASSRATRPFVDGNLLVITRADNTASRR
jgi:hypothetical protein